MLVFGASLALGEEWVSVPCFMNDRTLNQFM